MHKYIYKHKYTYTLTGYTQTQTHNTYIHTYNHTYFQVRVHTWRDATLGEITELLAQVHREVRQGGTRCSFKVIRVCTCTFVCMHVCEEFREGGIKMAA